MKAALMANLVLHPHSYTHMNKPKTSEENNCEGFACVVGRRVTLRP